MTEKMLSILNRWRWPASVAVALFSGSYAAVGFGWPVTPRQQFNSLRDQAKIETAQRAEADSAILDTLHVVRTEIGELRIVRARDGDLIRSLAVLRCLDGTPRSLTRAAGLRCAELVDPSP